MPHMTIVQNITVPYADNKAVRLELQAVGWLSRITFNRAATDHTCPDQAINTTREKWCIVSMLPQLSTKLSEAEKADLHHPTARVTLHPESTYSLQDSQQLPAKEVVQRIWRGACKQQQHA